MCPRQSTCLDLIIQMSPKIIKPRAGKKRNIFFRKPENVQKPRHADRVPPNSIVKTVWCKSMLQPMIECEHSLIKRIDKQTEAPKCSTFMLNFNSIDEALVELQTFEFYMPYRHNYAHARAHMCTLSWSIIC